MYCTNIMCYTNIIDKHGHVLLPSSAARVCICSLPSQVSFGVHMDSSAGLGLEFPTQYHKVSIHS